MNSQEILKSLNSLEASLKEINSAKEQVVTITSSVKDLADVMTQYSNSLNVVSSSISDILKESKEFNLKTLEEQRSTIVGIQGEAKKLTTAIASYILEIKEEQQKIIEEFGGSLQSNTSLLKSQIARLSNTDLDAGFKSLQKQIDCCEGKICEKSIKAVEKGVGELKISNKSSYNDVLIKINTLQEGLETVKDGIGNEIKAVKKGVVDCKFLHNDVLTGVKTSQKKIDAVENKMGIFNDRAQKLENRITYLNLAAIVFIIIELMAWLSSF